MACLANVWITTFQHGCEHGVWATFQNPHYPWQGSKHPDSSAIYPSAGRSLHVSGQSIILQMSTSSWITLFRIYIVGLMTISSGIFQPHRRINSATSSDMRIDTYTHIFIYAYTHIYIYTYTYTYIYVHTYTLGPGTGPRALAPGLPGHTRAARQPRGQGPGPGPGP